MLVLSHPLLSITSCLAVCDPSSTAAIVTAFPADFRTCADSLPSNVFLATEVTASIADTLGSFRSDLQQGIPGNIRTPDELFAFLSATFFRVSEILASTKNSDFEPIIDNPLAVLSTVGLVTVSDMIPFVPCQPLAISLGARYGAWAYPVCVVGQTLAGVLAFQSSRRVSDAEGVRRVIESLGEDGQLRFQKFRTESLLGGDGDTTTDAANERTIFFGLVGLRLAPFFPFSAGNYLLGGATDVGLRPFVLATILGCMVSNLASILVGMGGAELLMNTANQ